MLSSHWKKKPYGVQQVRVLGKSLPDFEIVQSGWATISDFACPQPKLRRPDSLVPENKNPKKKKTQKGLTREFY